MIAMCFIPLELRYLLLVLASPATRTFVPPPVHLWLATLLLGLFICIRKEICEARGLYIRIGPSLLINCSESWMSFCTDDALGRIVCGDGYLFPHQWGGSYQRTLGILLVTELANRLGRKRLDPTLHGQPIRLGA